MVTLSLSHAQIHVCSRTNTCSQESGLVQQEDGIVSKPGCEAEFKHRSVQAKQHSTSSLIGGISAAEDQYKTTAHRLQNMEGNTRDQLVLKNRIGSKKLVNAQFEQSHHQQNQNVANYQQQYQQRQQDQQQQGYQFSATGMGGKNFTSNLGVSLLSRVPDKPSATPIDPNSYTKTMLSQNYKPQPGYTGHKKW